MGDPGGLTSLCEDLQEEEDALDRLVAPLGQDDWMRLTPAEGWDIRDQVSHLATGADDGRMTLADHDAFDERLAMTREERQASFLTRGRSLSGSEVLAWWRQARAAFADHCARLKPGDRVRWYGPSMSARSFVTARLMETWAHGQDVADALDVCRSASPRLRHIAHLGVVTRPWSYSSRGLAVPDRDVRVELHGPEAEVWSWGDSGLLDRIAGTLLDFCLVVTRRRHVDDTDLHIEGRMAREWMEIAQAYAGPAGSGRAPGQFARVAGQGQTKEGGADG